MTEPRRKVLIIAVGLRGGARVAERVHQQVARQCGLLADRRRTPDPVPAHLFVRIWVFDKWVELAIIEGVDW